MVDVVVAFGRPDQGLHGVGTQACGLLSLFKETPNPRKLRFSEIKLEKASEVTLVASPCL